ncbi:hypothetical protein Leryth_021543, partial [Lithospermum erythrorhizon]
MLSTLSTYLVRYFIKIKVDLVQLLSPHQGSASFAAKIIARSNISLQTPLSRVLYVTVFGTTPADTSSSNIITARFIC